MNQITINFYECEPTPNGYNILYRPFGSDDPYTDAGNFTESPAVFTDDVNPNGTSYEGIIRSDCGETFGPETPWTAFVSVPPDEESGMEGVAYTFCGRGNTESEACADATANVRTFWSPCALGDLGPGCEVYTNHSMTNLLTGYTKIFMAQNWDISITGVIIGSSAIQC
jgi:hypothetical protein